MRVLIYEPGKTGHRPVYLRYIADALQLAKCETVIIADDYTQRLAQLARMAKTQRCEYIFVCTLDGLYYPRIVLLGLFARVMGVRVIGIYYLFNNLYEGWKGHMWRMLIHSSLLSHVFTPDLRLADRLRLAALGSRVSYLADPWDAALLREIDRNEAVRAFLGALQASHCVFLFLGEITVRKGIPQLIEVLGRWDFLRRPNLKVLLAGRLADDMSELVRAVRVQSPALSSAIMVQNRWIDESEHSKFFSIASYLCAIYPRDFKVSISTVIRAFAVRRPVLVGNHGMMGEIVQKSNAGFVCDTDSPTNILSAMEKAYDVFLDDVKGYQTMSCAGRALAMGSELAHFKATLFEWVHQTEPKH